MQTVIPELGQLALIIALGVALVQGVLPLIGAQRGLPAWIAAIALFSGLNAVALILLALSSVVLLCLYRIPRQLG